MFRWERHPEKLTDGFSLPFEHINKEVDTVANESYEPRLKQGVLISDFGKRVESV